MAPISRVDHPFGGSRPYEAQFVKVISQHSPVIAGPPFVDVDYRLLSGAIRKRPMPYKTNGSKFYQLAKRRSIVKTKTTGGMAWTAYRKAHHSLQESSLKVRPPLLLSSESALACNAPAVDDSSRNRVEVVSPVNESCGQQGCRAYAELSAYQIEPWTSVSELIKVHHGIYTSLRYETNQFDPTDDFGKKVHLDDASCLDGNSSSSSPMGYSRDKLTEWRHSLSDKCSNTGNSGNNVILLSHITSIESLLNALLETHTFSVKYPSGAANNSVLYSLYSIAVINFCNALASYETKEVLVNVNGEQSGVGQATVPPVPAAVFTSINLAGTVPKYAKIFHCPSWIVNCRNNLSHSSACAPSLSLLHEAITFALDWMDRYFWCKVLLDQCNRFDVDMRNVGPYVPDEVPCKQCADDTVALKAKSLCFKNSRPPLRSLGSHNQKFLHGSRAKSAKVLESNFAYLLGKFNGTSRKGSHCARETVMTSLKR